MSEHVKVSELKERCRRARDDEGFALFIDLCVVDRPRDEERFECIYRVCNPENGEQISFFTKLSEHDVNTYTVSDIWPAVGWYEREAFDMFGIYFAGNENLSRLLTPEDFKGHPLRKDFGG